jgi:hypothetical protein
MDIYSAMYDGLLRTAGNWVQQSLFLINKGTKNVRLPHVLFNYVPHLSPVRTLEHKHNLPTWKETEEHKTLSFKGENIKNAFLLIFIWFWQLQILFSKDWY